MKNLKFLSGIFTIAALVFIAACSCSNDGVGIGEFGYRAAPEEIRQ